MKYVKTLGWLVMAASLMVFPCSASAAPTLTSPPGTEYTGEIHLSLEPGTSLLLKAGIVEWTCTKSTAMGRIEANNTTHAEAALSGLSLEGCTGDTRIISPGSLTFDDNGTAFTKETKIEIKNTLFGFTCFYGAEATPVDIGTLTPGTTATLDVSTTHLKRLPGGAGSNYCGVEGVLSGNYLVTVPDTLLIT